MLSWPACGENFWKGGKVNNPFELQQGEIIFQGVAIVVWVLHLPTDKNMEKIADSSPSLAMVRIHSLSGLNSNIIIWLSPVQHSKHNPNA